MNAEKGYQLLKKNVHLRSRGIYPHIYISRELFDLKNNLFKDLALSLLKNNHASTNSFPK